MMKNNDLVWLGTKWNELISFNELWTFLCYYRLELTIDENGINMMYVAKVYQRPDDIADLMALLPKDKDFLFKPDPAPEGLREKLEEPDETMFFLYELFDHIEKCIIIQVEDDLPDIHLLLNNGTRCRVNYNIA